MNDQMGPHEMQELDDPAFLAWQESQPALTPIECVRNQIAWIKRLLGGDLKSRGHSDMSGHPHGFTVAEVPDWDLRQKLAILEEALNAN